MVIVQYKRRDKSKNNDDILYTLQPNFREREITNKNLNDDVIDFFINSNDDNDDNMLKKDKEFIALQKKLSDQRNYLANNNKRNNNNTNFKKKKIDAFNNLYWYLSDLTDNGSLKASEIEDVEAEKKYLSAFISNI